MNITEKLKRLCFFHTTIIELGDENYYSDWISHECGLPDKPMLSTLCEIDDSQFLVINHFFCKMMHAFQKEHDISNKDMSIIYDNGKKESIIFYDALIYQMLEDMSV